MNPLQRAAVRRKIYYFAAIAVLFTVSMLWRGIIPIPMSNLAAAPTNQAQKTANWAASKSILNQSISLDLRELEQGDPELAGEGMRLALTGSRGFAVAYLWYSAIEAQKRNDFHKMEGQITQVTRLQPHFITPWIFQSWNIAYNVSVEMHGSGDMYFYIARGIELLAEGERRNSHLVKDPSGGDRKIGSPDIRYQIAFYYQNKFGVSDQVEVLRCLFQLSCMPENERNPDNLIDPVTKKVDLEAFRKFCEKHPHLVRRLRGEDVTRATGTDEMTSQKLKESLKCPTPEKIIQFLRDNKEIPTRYKNSQELSDPEKQFPVLPQKFDADEANPSTVTGDDFSAFRAARAWFVYANAPLPPNPRDWENRPMPWRTPYPDEYNQLLYRVPRQPLMIIFRQGAPRVQSYQAELEQKEGWFDDEGWRIDDPADPNPNNWWFPNASRTAPLNVIVGTERPWSLQEWQTAARMWSDHGEAYGMDLKPDRLLRYEQRAKLGPAALPLDPTPEQLASDWFQAGAALLFYHQNRSVCNFPFFLASSAAEAQPGTVLARKTLWKAEQARKYANKPLATQLYIDGLRQWKEVLRANRDFHRTERSDRTEEQTYEYELAYLRMLVQDDQSVREKANEVVGPCRRVIPFLTYPFPETLRQTQAAANERAQAAAPGFLRVYMPTPYPNVLTRAQRTANESSADLRAAAPNFLRPFLPLPFPDAEGDSPVDTPQWGKDAREGIKWYVAERFYSPFSEPMDVNDDRRGGPWIRDEIKNSVRVSLGLQRGTTEGTTMPPGGPTPAPVPSGRPGN